MADNLIGPISQITLPSGATYYIKDYYAWKDLVTPGTTITTTPQQWLTDKGYDNLADAIIHLQEVIASITGGNAVVFKGVSSTALTDGGNENPTIGGNTVTTKNTGDLYFYDNEEFIYGSDNKWHSLGEPLSQLGALAYKDTASVTSSFSGTPATITINSSNVSSGETYTPTGTVSGGTLSLNTLSSTGAYTPAGSITSTFNGTAATITTKGTPSGTVSQPTFSGTPSTLTSKGTPSGTVSQPTFSGTSATITTKGTPSGTVSQPTFSGAQLTSTGTYTPTGTVSKSSAGSTTTIKNPTSVTVAKTLETHTPSTASGVNNQVTYCTYDNETLKLYQVGYTTGDSITTTNTTVKTGDATYSFGGAAATITVNGTPSGTVSQPTFSGAQLSSTASYTPAGTVSQPTFSGAQLSSTVAYTPAGTVSQPTFSGAQLSSTAAYTPGGSVTSSFSGTAATITSSGTPSGSVSALSFTGQKVKLTGTYTPAGTVTSTITFSTTS